LTQQSRQKPHLNKAGIAGHTYQSEKKLELRGFFEEHYNTICM